MNSTSVKPAIRSIAILGGGLAAWMMAAYLTRHVPESVEITVYGKVTPIWSDALYGSQLPPEFYGFHASLDIDEPTLLRRTDAAFSYGTWFEHWGETKSDWIQAFHSPLKNLDGVPLSARIAQLPDKSLQDLLVSALAARAGRFAHPHQDPRHPLSRAEYGYLIDPHRLAELYKQTAKGVAHKVTGALEVVESGEQVYAVQLGDGTRLDADLFIDASGADRVMRPLSSAARSLSIGYTSEPNAALEHAATKVAATETSWTSDTVTRAARLKLTVSGSAPSQSKSEIKSVQAGRTQTPWRGNYIAIGQAACTLEPLTVAPMRLLLSDVQRVAELFPVSTDMRIEAREYNRAAAEAQDNALIFHFAHMADLALPNAAYWTDAKAWSHPNLERLLRQYSERGAHVLYDNALFHPADWAILHDGLRRKPRRADALASQGDPKLHAAQIQHMSKALQSIVQKMPPHQAYMTKLLDYLERTQQAGQRHVG